MTALSLRGLRVKLVDRQRDALCKQCICRDHRCNPAYNWLCLQTGGQQRTNGRVPYDNLPSRRSEHIRDVMLENEYLRSSCTSKLNLHSHYLLGQSRAFLLQDDVSACKNTCSGWAADKLCSVLWLDSLAIPTRLER